MGVEHLLHARTAFGAFVEDEDHVAGFNGPIKDGLAGFLLGVVDLGGTYKMEDGLIYTSCFDNAPFLGDVTVEDSQTAIFGVGVFDAANAAFLAICVQIWRRESTVSPSSGCGLRRVHSCREILPLRWRQAP